MRSHRGTPKFAGTKTEIRHLRNLHCLSPAGYWTRQLNEARNFDGGNEARDFVSQQDFRYVELW